MRESLLASFLHLAHTTEIARRRHLFIMYVPRFTLQKGSREASLLVTIFFTSEKRRIDALIGSIVIFTGEKLLYQPFDWLI